MGDMMTLRSFDIWRRRGTIAGQRQFANTIRTLIFRADEQLFEQLDFADDRQFLHPVLFAYFTDPAPRISLPQALYGVMPRQRRPSQIDLLTDGLGRASLGPAGVIATDLPSQPITFSREPSYQCYGAGREVAFLLHPPTIIPDTQMAVTVDADPIFSRFFDQPIIAPARDKLADLLLALALMRAYCPAIWSEIAATVRLIVLYCAEAPNSFAALSAHGAIFCNVADGENEIALLEDVTHQGAHVLFNAFAHTPSRLLRIDPETPIRDLSSEQGETRTLFEAFHGLFTYTLICRVLSAVHDADELSELQSHEVLARLGLTLCKYRSDLARLDIAGAYTMAGQRCFNAFAAEYALLQARYAGRTRFDYDNQPYVFDYRRFVERNGGPFPVALKVAS
jgi:hypothetical protein